MCIINKNKIELCGFSSKELKMFPIDKDKVELLKLSEITSIIDIHWCKEYNSMVVSCYMSFYGYNKFLVDDLKNATYIGQLIRSLDQYARIEELNTIKVKYVKKYLDIEKLAKEEIKRRKKYNDNLKKLKQEELDFYKNKLDSIIRKEN